MTSEPVDKHGRSLGLRYNGGKAGVKPKMQYLEKPIVIQQVGSGQSTDTESKPLTVEERLAKQRQENVKQAYAEDKPVRTIEMDPKNMYWPEYGLPKNVKIVYKQQTTKFAVLAPDEWKAFFDTLDASRTVKNTSTGLYDAYATAKAIGGGNAGVVAFVRETEGVEYLILKNYDKWNQTLLHGGIFKAQHPKVIELGIGALESTRSLGRYVKVTAPLEILVGSAINALQFILNDQYTLEKLGVDEARMFINILVSAGVAYVWAEAAPAYVATIVGTRVILVISSAIVWGVDKATNYSEKVVKFGEKLAKEVMDNFDD